MLMSIERMLILKSARIFADVSDDHLVEVAAGMTELFFNPGETIIRQGERGRSIYIIVSGRVAVDRDGERLAELDAREVFGELAAFDPGPRSATVTALEPTHLLELDNRHVEALMTHNIDMLRAVIRMLCRRLRAVETPALEATRRTGN